MKRLINVKKFSTEIIKVKGCNLWIQMRTGSVTLDTCTIWPWDNWPSWVCVIIVLIILRNLYPILELQYLAVSIRALNVSIIIIHYCPFWCLNVLFALSVAIYSGVKWSYSINPRKYQYVEMLWRCSSVCWLQYKTHIWLHCRVLYYIHCASSGLMMIYNKFWMAYSETTSQINHDLCRCSNCNYTTRISLPLSFLYTLACMCTSRSNTFVVISRKRDNISLDGCSVFVI